MSKHGHALRREPVDPESISRARYRWSCECGADFGSRAEHKARILHREHKALVAS